MLFHVRSLKDWLDLFRSGYFILSQVTCDYVMIIQLRLGSLIQFNSDYNMFVQVILC
jgi:hypothetical protein